MITTRISDGELERRWQALRVAMRAVGLDALVFQSSNDWLGGYVKWLTDIPANNGYPRSVIFHADEPMTVVEMGSFDGVRVLGGEDQVHRGVGDVLTSPAFLSVAYTHAYEGQRLADALKRRNYRHIGLVGAGSMAHGFVEAIRSALNGASSFEDATELVDAIKALKSTEEVSLIKAAAALQDEVFGQVLQMVRPGLRDVDVTSFVFHESHKLGSEQGVVLGGSAPLGVRSSFVGRHMQGRTLQPGDHLSLLIEVNGPGGFYTELGRTIVLGRASNELLDGFAAVKGAQDATLALMRPGVSCADIAVAHDAYMQSHGLPREGRLYAHGQGYDMVERPLIRHDETMDLAAGMCLAVHPGYETSSMFAVICDNYLLDNDGCGASLHKTEKRVFEIT